MKYVFEICIFVVILVLYLHIYFHLKVSNDLEVYSIEEPSKDKLEEICDLRQPALFECKMESIIETSNKTYLNDNYHAFEVQVRNTNEKDNDKEEVITPAPSQIEHAEVNKEEMNRWSIQIPCAAQDCQVIRRSTPRPASLSAACSGVRHRVVWRQSRARRRHFPL